MTPLRPLAVALLLPAGALAQDNAADLFDVMGLPELVQVMREEGLAYGAELSQSFLGTEPDPAWRATVSDIYDVDRLTAGVRARFVADLDPDAVSPLLDYFRSEAGQRVVSLELEARRALLDEATDEAARLAASDAAADDTVPYRLTTEFIEVNDLIASNLEGTLNAQLAFYEGLALALPPGTELPQDEIIADLWAQRGEIEADTLEWLYAYLILAYSPLDDEELRAYVDFTASPSGQALNRALFSSFDWMFLEVSRDLGVAAGQAMAGQDL